MIDVTKELNEEIERIAKYIADPTAIWEEEGWSLVTTSEEGMFAMSSFGSLRPARRDVIDTSETFRFIKNIRFVRMTWMSRSGQPSNKEEISYHIEFA